jgi:hypothetical protein
MTTPQPLTAWTGELHLTPGAPVPRNLRSTRPALVDRLTQGRSARDLPGLLASLFSLCGHAHRLCARWAIAAAAPEQPAPEPALIEGLRRETALEHLRRMGLDWPRLLDAGAGVNRLRGCPLLARSPSNDDDWPALRSWIEAEWLHVPAEHWLAAWDADGASWLREWSQHEHGWLAALLRVAHDADDPTPIAPALALCPHAPEAARDLLAFGAALDADPHLAQQPRWRGACAHTGTWTRLRREANGPLTAWSLLGARIAELIRLSQPTAPGRGADWLCCGSLASGPRRGLAWVEMARGLLLHQVRLDGEGEGNDDMATVRACQVVAPTEWNFHPEGVVAQALARVPPSCSDREQSRRAHLLMAAFDPCLPFVLMRRSSEEIAHA